MGAGKGAGAARSERWRGTRWRPQAPATAAAHTRHFSTLPLDSGSAALPARTAASPMDAAAARSMAPWIAALVQLLPLLLAAVAVRPATSSSVIVHMPQVPSSWGLVLSS